MNAVTHGLTARLAILPDEDGGKFEHRMREWKEIFRPRNGYESFQTETVVYLSWQLERARRAQSARLCFVAETAAEDRDKEQEQEVAELTVQLFRRQAAARADGPQSEGKVLQSDGAWPDSFDGANHPAVLVGRLESFLTGCEKLREHWTELAAIVENGQAWQAAERFKAVRLLGAHPNDAIVAPGLIDLLRACQVLDPHAGDLVNELLPERLAATTDRSNERPNDTLPPMDETAARQVLLAIAHVEIERLATLAEELQDRAEFEQALSPHQLAFDHTADGEKMRRYETTCSSRFDRLVNELTKRKGNAPVDRYAPVYTDYRTERPDLNARVLAAMASAKKIDATEPIDSSGPCDTDDSPAPKVQRPATEVQRPTMESGPAAKSEAPLRNEPTVVGGPPLRNEPTAVGGPSLRNEPTAVGGPDLRAETKAAGAVNSQQASANSVVTPERKSERVAAVGQVLRNEPTGATYKGMHLLGNGRPAMGGGSRRARRARQAKDRVNGVPGVESALNLIGPRARNLMMPVGLQ